MNINKISFSGYILVKARPKAKLSSSEVDKPERIDVTQIKGIKYDSDYRNTEITLKGNSKPIVTDPNSGIENHRDVVAAYTAASLSPQVTVTVPTAQRRA